MNWLDLPVLGWDSILGRVVESVISSFKKLVSIKKRVSQGVIEINFNFEDELILSTENMLVRIANAEHNRDLGVFWYDDDDDILSAWLGFCGLIF